MQTILVVDDSQINRIILRKILSEEYRVIESRDGREALDLLDHEKEKIAAIMLDLIMPGLDGYGFLREFAKRKECRKIPVIVSTGETDKENEIKALRLGAWDFIGKPYIPEIVMFRLQNAILRSQLSAFQKLEYQDKYDTLTDIYNKKKFFAETREILLRNKERTFAFLRFDIDRFHLINSYFGMKKGDEVLIHIAKFLKEYAKSFEGQMTYGWVEADIFACCVSVSTRIELKQLMEDCSTYIKKFVLSFDMVPIFGICEISDNEMAVDEIYDRANLAAKTRKGNYVSSFAYYEDFMGEEVEREQEIVNEMNRAIEEEQFEVWYQPKQDIRMDAPAGAEALIRWRHPTKGMISPGHFIPIFEHNGFISKLDRYVWEHVCRDLHRWMEEGKEPQPVSVNISRVDLSDPNLLQDILGLTKKYEIPNALLQLELTESAYTDNPERMTEIMKQFQESGFTILMDDFGSGYSSLSMLKDIDVNILKIDMRFFSKTNVEGRGESIIASVVRMAKWLRIPVVAEGVETREQVNFLRGLGCEYVQGFYFAKPMPKEEYETYINNHEKVAGADILGDILADRDWQKDPGSEDVMQPAAIFEMEKEELRVIRVNNAFYDMFGFQNAGELFASPVNKVNPKDREKFLLLFKQVRKNRDFGDADYRQIMQDGSEIWVHIKVRYFNHIEDRYLIYGAFSDVTAIKNIDEKLERYRFELKEKLGNRKILVVDDLEVNRISLRLMMEKEFQIVEAENGEEALKVLEESDGEIDLILLDLFMPVMDGKQFMFRLKKNEAFSNIPVVIITADESIDPQAEFIKLGVRDYIVKPFVKEVVLRRVRNVLEAHCIHFLV